LTSLVVVAVVTAEVVVVVVVSLVVSVIEIVVSDAFDGIVVVSVTSVEIDVVSKSVVIDDYRKQTFR
jgi:hypothetical protein